MSQSKRRVDILKNMLLIVPILLAICPAASQAQPSASERMVARLQQIASEVRAQVPPASTP